MRERQREGSLGTLFWYEMKMLLRDTRTILIAVVPPIILFPAYIFLLNHVESREQQALEEATFTWTVFGSRTEWAADLVESAIQLERSDPDTSGPPASFRRVFPEDPLDALAEGDVHVAAEGLTPSQWDSMRAADSVADASGDPSPGNSGDEALSALPSVPALRLHFRGESDFSREARSLLANRILEVRAQRRDSVFRAAGFPVAMEEVGTLETMSIATAAKETGAILGVALMPFLVLLMLSGGSIMAVDAISGEKERGTLETLLTTAADRKEIVWSKLLAVTVVGLSTVIITVANLLLYLVVGLLELPENFAVEVSLLDLSLLFVLFLPVSVLVASTLLLLSGVARSYKEYQVYFLPVFLVFLLPCAAPGLPGIDLRSVIALVPLAGIAVAVREILVGEIDLPFVILAFLSTSGVAAWLTRLTQNSLSNEKLISGAELEAADLTGGKALFPRHVFRWFLGLWVVFFLVSLWSGETLGIRVQLVVNLLGIFFGGSLFLVRRYGLDPREAFYLRMPHPASWLAVLAGAPAALLVGAGLAEMVNRYVFPVPQELLESFGQSLTGPDLPLWQMILFLAILPGVFEELAFRGVLLRGLGQRIRRPWLLALTVGLIFGAFHISLFRIAPTAFLGFILTWVVLFGGSIYPAMAWHALNNALAILPARLGWLPQDFTPRTWWALPAGLILLGSLWILKRTGPWAQGNRRGEVKAGNEKGNRW